MVFFPGGGELHGGNPMWHRLMDSCVPWLYYPRDITLLNDRRHSRSEPKWLFIWFVFWPGDSYTGTVIWCSDIDIDNYIWFNENYHCSVRVVTIVIFRTIVYNYFQTPTALNILHGVIYWWVPRYMLKRRYILKRSEIVSDKAEKILQLTAYLVYL